jgi:hypothetical protein
MSYPLTIFSNPRRRRPRRNGRSRTPAYRVEFDGVVSNGRAVGMTASGWDVRKRGQIPGNGAPTAANLERYVIAIMQSTEPGGVNAHLGRTTIQGAHLIRQSDGAEMATYRLEDSLADQVWDLQHGPPGLAGYRRPRRNRPRRSSRLERRERRNPETLPTLVAIPQSEHVYQIKYKHIEDGEDYVHNFAPGTCMELLADGSVRLYRMDGRPLFRDFV